MVNMRLNVPYGEMWSGVKKVGQFTKPLAAHALAGSLAGASIGAIAGNGHTVRDGLIGGAAGALGSPLGRSFMGTFNRGAMRTAGAYDMRAGAAAVRSRGVGRWNGLGRLASRG